MKNKTDFKPVLLLVLFILAAQIVSQSANAATVVTPAVEGLSGGTFKPLTTPALTGPNFVATGKVLINGKLVPIPGYIPPASTAAQAAKTSLWLNPWLIGASLLGWAGDAGLTSDLQVSGWVKTTPAQGDFESTAASCDMPGYGIGYASSRSAACAEAVTFYPYNCPNYGPGGSCISPGELLSQTLYKINQTQKIDWGGGNIEYLQSSFNKTVYTTGELDNDVGGTEPATQDDFNSLPAPPLEALAELAPQVGVPVNDPVYDPVDVPIGDPYTRPDGSTAQPMAKISPQSGGQVAIDTYDQPINDPQGNPIPDPDPIDTPEPQPDFCQSNPQSISCLSLGSDSFDMPSKSINFAFAAESSPIGAGSCPAGINVLGNTLSFQPACDAMGMIRPLILGLASLMGAYIFIGGIRGGD